MSSEKSAKSNQVDTTKSSQKQDKAQEATLDNVTDIWGAVQLSRTDPKNLSQNQIMALQRTLGNEKTIQLLGQNTDNPHITNAPSGTVQRGLLSWIRKKFAKKEDEIPLLGEDSDSEQEPQNQSALEITYGDYGVTVEGKKGSIQLPLWGGSKLKLTGGEEGSSGEISGDMPSQSVKAKIPAASLSLDVPLPVPGVYVTAGLDVTPKLGVTFGGGTYTLAVSGEELSAKVEGTGITGTLGLDVSVTTGVGVGIALVAGLEAGLFAGASASFDLSGTLAGEVKKKKGQDWTNTSLTLTAASKASLVGKAGTYIKAKLLALSATKKWTLAKKEFATLDYNASVDWTKKGFTLADFKPKKSDFTITLNSGSARQLFPQEEVIDERTPLLSGSGDSD